MPRRSPIRGAKMRVAVRLIPAPPAHFAGLLLRMRSLGYFDPRQAAIAAIDAGAERNAMPAPPIAVVDEAGSLPTAPPLSAPGVSP